ncbi:hypothetical protein ACWGLF_37310 [Streptomyces puniciscabiei]
MSTQAGGRRMESRWSHDRPGHQCRHGRTSATRPDPGRIPNTYVREDHVLRHLPALSLPLTAHRDPPGRAAVTRGAMQPPTMVQAIAHLRSEEILLVCDPATRTLPADSPQTEGITIC